MEEILNWIALAYKFLADGDAQGMRAAAREVFDLDGGATDGAALMALAALYSGDDAQAELLAQDAMSMDGTNVNARLAYAGMLSKRFALTQELPLLKKLIKDVERSLEKANDVQNDLNKRLHLGREMPEDERSLRQRTTATLKICTSVLRIAEGWYADALYLAADPTNAADALLKASNLAADKSLQAAYYSKYLFMLNYRSGSSAKSCRAAAKFNDFFSDVVPFDHSGVNRSPNRKLRIGYLSAGFRLHPTAYFLTPLLRDFNRDEYIVHCYSRCRADEVTGKLRRYPIQWRDLRGKDAATAARIIRDDHIDILVDLSGHDNDNCLNIMAYRPAPVQISGIGSMATTGLNAIDYFITDKVCMPAQDTAGFTEKLLKLDCCHFCYSPGGVREMPVSGVKAPVIDNGYVTFGCFNNFNKVSDDLLCIWRGVMERTANSHLIIKSKICSVQDGRDILTARLKGLFFDLSRVELRPYSPNYLEEYRDIDIALDTMPYNGGLTTCEALFMGVPVVAMRGKTHGSRFGASILTHADLTELIARNQMEYVTKLSRLAAEPKLLHRYHNGLREHLHRSALMDAKNYMRCLESAYRKAWRDFCNE